MSEGLLVEPLIPCSNVDIAIITSEGVMCYINDIFSENIDIDKIHFSFFKSRILPHIVQKMHPYLMNNTYSMCILQQK